MEQTLFDSITPTVKQQADFAIKKGLDNADSIWKEKALEAIHDLCLKQLEFTADDIRFVLTEEEAETHDRRAMGGIMRTASKNGWCESTGRYEASKFTHGHLHQVWKSKLFLIK